MLRMVATKAAAAGVSDRVTVLYCDLGHVVWPGTLELTRLHAQHYGLRFEIRRREQGPLLDQVRRRGKWPSAAARYCTSDQKRAPARKLITALVRERGDLGRPARVLNCMGLRAAESRARARRPILSLDEPASSGRRQVWTWLPIRDWTTPRVWTDIHASGVPYHPIYDLGLSRLSCSLCVLASRSDLVRACQLRPDLADQYAALETALGHQFRHNAPMADLIVEANSRPCSPPPTGRQAAAVAGAGTALAPDVLADVRRVLAEHTARFGSHCYLDQIRSALTTPTGSVAAGSAGCSPVTWL